MSGQEKCENIIKGLECCTGYCDDDTGCPYSIYDPVGLSCQNSLRKDAIALLKAQNEVIEDLLKVGYPHNFQREEPWIVDYMYAITNVIKKAVKL